MTLRQQISQAKRLVKTLTKVQLEGAPAPEPEIAPVSLGQAKQASIQAMRARAKAEQTQGAADWQLADLYKSYADELVEALLIQRGDVPEIVEALELPKIFRKTGPPGPPPRPGLEWKETTHRWVRPKVSDWGGRQAEHTQLSTILGAKQPTHEVMRLGVRDATLAKLESKNQLRQYASQPLLPEDPQPALAKLFGELDYVNAFEQTMENSALYMAISGANLQKVLGAGEFKNAAQTGTGGSSVSARERFQYEQEVFGLSEGDFETPQVLPKYGFMASRTGMDHERILELPYGHTYVKFKDEVRNKATLTIGDSMNENVYGVAIAPPTSVTQPEPSLALWNLAAEAEDPWFVGERLNQRKRNRERWVAEPTWERLAEVGRVDYLEAQYHGPLQIADIDVIEVQSKQLAEKLRKQLTDLELTEIKVLPGKFDSRLRRLIQPEVGDYFPSLSPSDVERLGDFYIGAIVRRLIKAWHIQKRDSYWFDAPSYIDEAVVQGNKFLGAPIEVQRKWLQRVVSDVAQLGDDLKPGYRPRMKGFTTDVINPALLERYPVELDEYYDELEDDDDEGYSLGEVSELMER